MAGEDAKKDEDELVMVGDGVDDDRSSSGEDDDDRRDEGGRGDEDEQGKDRRKDAGRDQNDDEDDDDDDDEQQPRGDARLGADDDARTDEEKREARREERRRRKQARRERRDRELRELKFLRSRNEQVERQLSELASRVGRTEASTVESRKAQLQSAIRNADSVIARAISEGDGEATVEAQRIRDGLMRKMFELEQSSPAESRDEGQEARRSPEGRGGEARRRQPDPLVVDKVREWHRRNSWYDFERRDQDSAVVYSIDVQLKREGYDPRTDEYYEEMDERIAKYLPHRAQRDDDDDGRDDDRRDRRGRSDDQRRQDGRRRESGERSRGPKFRQRSADRPLRKNEVRITEERRRALEEAGVWDDPELRKKYLKRYRQYDEEHGLV